MDEDDSRNAREERLLSESEKQVSEYDRIATLDAERPASQIEWWLAVRRSDDGELPHARAAAARVPTATASAHAPAGLASAQSSRELYVAYG